MSRKERQFAKSQEWLAWLSDSPNTAPTPTPKISQQGYKAEQPRPNSATQAHQERPGHSLGLRADMFATRASAHPQHAARAPRRSLRAPSQSARAVKPPQPTTSHEETIAIRIDLPKIHLPTVAIPWAKILRWGVPIAVAAALIIVTPAYLHNRSEKAKEKTASSSNAKELSYAPLKPTGKPSATLGSKYDSQHQVYSFTDKYLGRSLTVSEQPLPDEIRADPSKLTKAAEAIKAKETFTTASGTVYIATYKDQGVQQMILMHRQLLVYITSTGGTLENDQWVTYIQSLE